MVYKLNTFIFQIFRYFSNSLFSLLSVKLYKVGKYESVTHFLKNLYLLLYSSLGITRFIVLSIFWIKLPKPSLPIMVLKLWTQSFLTNSSTLKGLDKYLFVSINENLWKHLSILVLNLLLQVFCHVLTKLWYY